MKRAIRVPLTKHKSNSLRVRRLLDAPDGASTWQELVVGVLLVLILFASVAFGLMGIDLMLTALL